MNQPELPVRDGVERPYSAAVATAVGERLALLAQPMRLRILDVLDLRGELHVQALADALGTTQQNVSHHLHLLLVSGLVARRNAGRMAWYRVADPAALGPVHDAVRSLAGRR